jgi:DNA-directed RNA polymerase specialized sigma24 family protein
MALTLRWGEELSYRDIGALLGVSEQAAQMLVARAKRDLQAVLDPP